MTVCSSRHNSALMPVAAIAAGTLALSASLFTAAHASSVPADPQSEVEWIIAPEEGKWRPYIELLGRMSDDGSLGQADVFVPLAQNLDSLLFFNLRGHTNFNHQGEFNIGLGYRHKFDNWILGGYGYFDQSKGESGQRYRQATFGVEALGEHWDLRFNGYLPEEQAATSFGQVVINANQISVDVRAEKALRGVDGEVGLRIGGRNTELWAGAKLPSNDLRFFAGGYHFEEDSGIEAITGGRFRAEWGFDNLPRFGDGSRFSIGVETQYDESRGSRTAGLVRLRLPLGTGDLKDNDDGDAASYAAINSGLDRRMVTPVVRDVDIVVGSGQANVVALNPAGQEYQQYLEYHSRADVEDGTDHASGDRKAKDEVILVNMIGGEDDANNWKMADSSYAADDRSFATAGNGVSYTLAGKDTPIGFDDPFTGSRGKTSFVPDGTTPDLVFDRSQTKDDTRMFVLSAGDHINGWELDVNSTTGAKIYERGLLLDTSGEYYVTNSLIENSRRIKDKANIAGIEVKGDDSTLYVWDSEFRKNGTKGQGEGGLVALEGGKIIAENVNLHHNVGVGLQSDGAGSTIDIRNSSVSFNLKRGMEVSNGGTLYADRVTANNNVTAGLWVVGAGSTAYVRNSDIFANKASGVRVREGGNVFADNR